MMTNMLEISVERIHKIENHNTLKAFADINVNNALLIKSIRLIEGKNGLFISMPQEQSKDKRWFESVRCLNKDVREQIKQEVLSAYSSAMN